MSSTASSRVPGVTIAPSKIGLCPASVQDVLKTDELHSRKHAPNWRNESRALYELARHMASPGSGLMNRLLELLLEVCGADSAGVSLLQTNAEGDEVWKWTNVTGSLGKYSGLSAPRRSSFCGVCLSQNGPQLFILPDRHFQYLKDVDPRIAEMLVIPMDVGDKKRGALWIASHTGDVKFGSEDARIMAGLAEFTGHALHLFKIAEQNKIAKESMEAEVNARTIQLQSLSAMLLVIQDDERRRLARELHDSVGQHLAAIRININTAFREAVSVKCKSCLADASDAAKQCEAEIRTMSYLLHPPLLDEMGLHSALPEFVDGFARRSGMRVQLQLPNELGRLPEEIETTLFRIVQQSLANIHRHSGSSTARIRMRLDNKNVIMEISDDGCGISPEILAKFRAGTGVPGVGIAGMRERVRRVQGRFDIHSGDRGTTIEVALPLITNPATAIS